MAARRVRGADVPALRTVHARTLRTMVGDVTDQVRGASWGWWDPSGERVSVLAIDIGKSAGWCVIGERGEVAHGEFSTGGPNSVTGPWLHGLEMAIDELEGIASIDENGNSSSLLVVEDVFLKHDPATHAALARMQGVAIGMAYEIAQLPALRVSPISWQSKMLGPKLERAAGKKASLERARREFGDAIKSEHMADAALMAKWVWCGPNGGM